MNGDSDKPRYACPACGRSDHLSVYRHARYALDAGTQVLTVVEDDRTIAARIVFLFPSKIECDCGCRDVPAAFDCAPRPYQEGGSN